MRTLYTLLLVILTVGIASAQESVLTISQVSHDGQTYTHIKGDDNAAENCFTATSSSTLSISTSGLDSATIYIDGAAFEWASNDARGLVLNFNTWDDYNRLYLNRGSQRPARAENIEAILFRCDGWSLDASGQWYVNSDFDGYAYNSVVSIDGLTHTPQLVASYTGTNPDLRPIADGGQRIYVGSFPTNDEAVAGVERAIREHMNPTEVPEEEEEDPAVDQWIQGTVQGFVGWGERTRQSWRNDIYPGYAYNTWENRHLPADEWFIRVGVLTSGVWANIDIPGVHATEAEADRIARAYIESRSSTDSYVSTAVGSYRITRRGDAAWYVEIRTPAGTLSIFRAFTNRDDALAFATDPGAYVSMDSFELSDFETTYSNAGWLAGIHDGGNTNWTVTAPDHLRNTIEATWIWTDSQGAGHTGERFFTVPSTTTWYHGSTGVTYTSLEAIHERYPNTGQTRLDSGHFTITHVYAPGAVQTAQFEARDWAIDAINDFILNGPTSFNRN